MDPIIEQDVVRVSHRLNEHATVERYTEVLGILREQIAALGPDDLAKQTPCSEWDALALVAHALGAMAYYAQLAGGDEKVRPVLVDLDPDDDLVPRFDSAAAQGIEAWSRPGALDGEVRNGIDGSQENGESSCLGCSRAGGSRRLASRVVSRGLSRAARSRSSRGRSSRPGASRSIFGARAFAPGTPAK